VNWYKAAAKQIVPVVTPERFGTMTSKEKGRLAENRRLTPELQLLLFTEPYERKSDVLWYLALNSNITQETQRLFFTEPYERKDTVLWYLALNPKITQETQRLFFTEKYPDKNDVLANLAWNPIFLQNFTPEQMLIVKNAARGEARLHVLKKRLEQLAGVP